MPGPSSELRKVRQEHGVRIVAASDAQPPADGLFLIGDAGTVAVRTADCLPVLLAAPRHRLVMALHAGWRGLSAGIVQQGVHLARELGVPSAELYAVLGPCISQARFEVGPEVQLAFAAWLDPTALALVATPGRDDRCHIDLTAAALFALEQEGVALQRAAALRSCTFDHPCLWPSFRRDQRTDPAIWSWIANG